MQAIQTKYHGPAPVKGARVTVRCQAKRMTVDWDHALDFEGNHRAAARACILSLGWFGHWVGGQMPDGTYVFVCSKAANGMHEGFDVWEDMPVK